MKRDAFSAACLAAVFLAAMAVSAGQPATAKASDNGAKEQATHVRQARQSSRFSNVSLVTQHGKHVRFYDDLVKDKVVIINMMYTTCTNLCPFYQVQLSKLHELMHRWVGKDVQLISISIDPENDTPAVLKQYWEAFGAPPGWLFLTGRSEDIEKLRRELGVYDLDPVIDADKSQHAGILTIGNDRSNRWLALPIMMHLRQLATTILRNVHDRHWQR